MLSVEMISRQNRCHYVYKGGNMMRRILHIVLITALMFLNVMYTFEAHPPRDNRVMLILLQ